MRNDGMKFLLQVWNTRGEMVFERPLKKPLSNWNINNYYNMLLF